MTPNHIAPTSDSNLWRVMVRNHGGFLAVVALLVILPLAWLNPIDTKAGQYVRDGLKQALVTFAVARAANATISVVKESFATANFSVMGVGGSATLAVGQILDPIDDLIESFSNLMLAACISFGIQLALLEVGKSVAVSTALSVFLVAWALAAVTGRTAPSWLAKILVLLMVARFSVPVAALGSEVTYRALLGQEHQAAQASLAATTRQLEAETLPADAGISKDLLDPKVWKAYAGRLKAKAEAWIENAIRVMAVFVVQTAILPLLFLWLVVWLARELFGWRDKAPWSWKVGKQEGTRGSQIGERG